MLGGLPSESEQELSNRECSPETEAESGAAGGSSMEAAPDVASAPQQWQLPRPMLLWRGFKQGMRRRAEPPVSCG